MSKRIWTPEDFKIMNSMLEPDISELWQILWKLCQYCDNQSTEDGGDIISQIVMEIYFMQYAIYNRNVADWLVPVWVTFSYLKQQQDCELFKRRFWFCFFVCRCRRYICEIRQFRCVVYWDYVVWAHVVLSVLNIDVAHNNLVCLPLSTMVHACSSMGGWGEIIRPIILPHLDENIFREFVLHHTGGSVPHVYHTLVAYPKWNCVQLYTIRTPYLV
jgi:hypothetical protein